MRPNAAVLIAGILIAVTAQAAPTSSVRKTAEQVATLLLEGKTDELQTLALDYELAARSLRKVERRGKAKYDEAMAQHLAYLVEQLSEGKQRGELALKRIDLAEVVTAPAGRGKRKTDIVLAQTRAVFELDGKETPGLEICFLAAEGRWQLVDKCR